MQSCFGTRNRSSTFIAIAKLYFYGFKYKLCFNRKKVYCCGLVSKSRYFESDTINNVSLKYDLFINFSMVGSFDVNPNRFWQNKERILSKKSTIFLGIMRPKTEFCTIKTWKQALTGLDSWTILTKIYYLHLNLTICGEKLQSEIFRQTNFQMKKMISRNFWQKITIRNISSNQFSIEMIDFTEILPIDP